MDVFGITLVPFLTRKVTRAKAHEVGNRASEVHQTHSVTVARQRRTHAPHNE